ncbi:MAG: twitching motility protein PilT [Micrococcales bacterium]|nr:twitching motility protein PilT [Micrococcales bacterium]
MSVVQPFIVLDAEAVSLLASADRAMYSWAQLAHDTDAVLRTSSLTLTETTDGTPRAARVHNALRIFAVRTIEVTDDIAVTAGRLRAQAAKTRRKARDLTVDAVVAATALALPAPVLVLTADPGDLSLLLDGTDVAVRAIAAGA